MRPLIRNGNIVAVMAPDGHHISVGDILVYEGNEGGLLIHRVWKMKDRIILKGDAGTFDKHEISETQIVGILVTNNPFLKGHLGWFTGEILRNSFKFMRLTKMSILQLFGKNGSH